MLCNNRRYFLFKKIGQVGCLKNIHFHFTRRKLLLFEISIFNLYNQNFLWNQSISTLQSHLFLSFWIATIQILECLKDPTAVIHLYRF